MNGESIHLIGTRTNRFTTAVAAGLVATFGPITDSRLL
jgi:hypothetical protein